MMSRALVTKSLRGLVAAASMIATSMMAQNAHTQAQPQVRVVNKVDATKVVQLDHTMPAVMANATIKDRLAPNTDVGQMYLLLKSSDEQELALRTLVDSQQDKGSPNYHQWMTPETFTNAFGVAKSDIAKVTAWLGDNGLTVKKVSGGGRVISFTGNAGQVENAFHTELHNVTVNGEAHVSNTVELSVPEALASVIHGVASLNNFGVKANAVNPRKAEVAADGTYTDPAYTSLSSGRHFVGPNDFSTIYNTKPLIAAGLDGRGVKIAVIGRTNISLADIQTFRTIFSLQPNDPTFTVLGPASGINSDDIESYLDVEWAAGVATAASVNFVTAGIELFSGGTDTASLYVVDNNNADIISLSYGGCEKNFGASGTAFWNTMWEQAAAQGQTVFVSTGDSGAAGCSSSSAAFATGTYGVNALGSSAFNVAVGGSMFNEGNASGVTPYWGVGGVAPYGTALSYIPEAAWSESLVNGGSGVSGGGGGVSIYTALPAFQAGPGVPTVDPIVVGGTITGQHRYVPDVSLISASAHDPTVICYSSVCKLNAAGGIASIGLVGGTSVATPVMASVQALVNQKNGGRQGNANYYYYKLAAAQTTAACNSTTGPASTCNFNDITAGNINVPSNSTGSTQFGFGAGAGYDLATGLGTPNVTNLATNWKNVTFNATTTALTLTPTTTVGHGTAHAFTVTVTPASGTAKPTGDVSIIATAANGGGNVYTLSGGTVSGNITDLPGGTYNVHAHYAGDTTFGGSDSPNVSITVAPEPSVTFPTVYLFVGGNLNPTLNFAYGQVVYVDVQVQGSTTTGFNPTGQPNTGTPSGTMTFTFTKGGVAGTPLVSNLDTYGITYLETLPGSPNFYLPANYPILTPGTYTLATAYSGDASFNASTGPAQTITVAKVTTAGTLKALSTLVAPSATATFNYAQTTVTSGNPVAFSGVPATGTVTFTDSTTTATLGTATLGANGSVQFTTNALIAPGAHQILASYSGDANYNAVNAPLVTVTVGVGLPTVTVLTAPAGGRVGNTIPLTATVTAPDAGTVAFYDGGVLLSTSTVTAATGVATFSVLNFTAGVHTLTAVYSGSATSASSTSAPLAYTVGQNLDTLVLTAQQVNLPGKPSTMTAALTLSPLNALPVNPAPTGTFTFSDSLNGATAVALGTAPLQYNATSGIYSGIFTQGSFGVGTHVLTATYSGDTNFQASTSNIQTLVIAKFNTTTSLGVSATTIGLGVNDVLTATVAPTPANTLPITGTVTFFDGTTSLGSGTLNASGVATLTTAFTVVAAHTITATYNGDANYNASTTLAGVVVTAITPSFSISVAPTTLAITRGVVPTPPVVTVTPVGNYSGVAVFGCTGLPDYTSCIFTPVSVSMTGNNAVQTATLQVFTLGAPSYAGFLWIPAGLLAGFVGLRRKQLTARGRQVLMLMVMACSMMAMSGCSDVKPYTPTGNFTLTINAVGTGTAGTLSPNQTATAPLALTIQ